MAKKLMRQEPTHRPPVTEVEQLWVFMAAIRRVEIFVEAYAMINETHFGQTDQWLAVVWRVVCDYYRKSGGKLPSQKVIALGCNAALKLSSDCIPENQVPQLNKFLKNAFAMTDEDFPINIVLASLKDFLEDSMVNQLHESLSRPQTPISLTSLFTKMQEQSATVSNLAAGELSVLLPDGWDVNTAIGTRYSTGLSFIDYYMDGGTSPGESYAILGAYGAGKTTLSVNMTATSAQQNYLRWVADGRVGVPPRAYHFYYEDTTDDIRLLALSFLAEIPRERMEVLIKNHDPAQYSTVGRYQPYEETRYRERLAGGHPVPGERERYAQAREIINLCLRAVDMTGADEANPGRGHGLVDEMAGIMSRDLQRSGSRASMALVDYASAAVRAHFSATNRDQSEVRTVLQAWPFEMKRKIGIKFHCPVWSMQQLNTEANACRPGHLPQMVDTPECRSFAENCNFCFVMGIPTRERQFPWVARKHRRSSALAPIILTLDGPHAKILDTREQWVLDERTKTIIARTDARGYHEVTGHAPRGDDVETFIPTDRPATRAVSGTPLPSVRSMRNRAAQNVLNQQGI